MKLRAYQFISILLFALVMGVFWGTWFSLSRTMETVTPPTFLEIGKQFINNLAFPMSVLMPLTILSTLPVLFFSPRGSVAFYSTLVALLLMIGALVITLAIEVPIDNMINVWTVETLPADWMALREKWEFYHVVRTFASLGAFGYLVTAALSSSVQLKTTK